MLLFCSTCSIFHNITTVHRTFFLSTLLVFFSDSLPLELQFSSHFVSATIENVCTMCFCYCFFFRRWNNSKSMFFTYCSASCFFAIRLIQTMGRYISFCPLFLDSLRCFSVCIHFWSCMCMCVCRISRHVICFCNNDCFLLCCAYYL